MASRVVDRDFDAKKADYKGLKKLMEVGMAGEESWRRAD
jgi:hypothetical protein